MLYVRCMKCREWDRKEMVFRYKMMVLTDWKPEAGIDPRMKQFKCPSCEAIEYKIPTTLQLQKEGEDRFE